jgi:6-pyruvoyltetrahydropterin/6-carboxytetrahydropterin synthase
MSVSLKRRAGFAAAHNYWLAALSEGENEALFGVYAGQEGHGHNYTVELTVEGEIDPRTGMVVNIAEIDRVLKREVVQVLDSRFLNREVAYFAGRAPTVENIARFAWEQVAPHLPSEGTLAAVKVWESPTLWAEVRDKKETEMVVSLTRAYDFSAAHRLHSKELTDQENLAIFGKCNNPHGHGHNYEVEVTLAGEPDPKTGMLYSLESLDRVVEEEVLKPFDHKHLNLDTPEFADLNPTSEMLTVVIWNKLARRLPTQGNPRLDKVVVRETARNYFEYRGDE